MISKKQYNRICGLMVVAGVSTSEEELCEMFSRGETTQLIKMKEHQIRALIEYLRILNYESKEAVEQVKFRILSYADNLGIIASLTSDKRLNFLLVNKYIKKQNLSKKLLNDMSLGELRKLCSQLKSVLHRKIKHSDIYAEALLADLINHLSKNEY